MTIKKRYDVVAPREGTRRIVKVGEAFQNDKGWDITLHVIPMQNHDDGIRLLIRESGVGDV